MQEAVAEEQRMAARYVNDIDIAKSQRDFELKKAAYDQEVRTKTAQSDLAYALQVTSFYIASEPYSTSNILCRVYLLSVGNCYAETYRLLLFYRSVGDAFNEINEVRQQISRRQVVKRGRNLAHS